jgi:hypothetical protein
MEENTRGKSKSHQKSLERLTRIRYRVKSRQVDNRFTTVSPGATIQRHWAEIRPVQNPDGLEIACNKPGSPAQLSATIAAGANITARWNGDGDKGGWPHNSGPLTVYMTECKEDCSSWRRPNEGEWFKIYQSGLLSGTVGKGTWATRQMIENGLSLTVQIPATLKPGNYLIRHETIVSFRTPITNIHILTFSI